MESLTVRLIKNAKYQTAQKTAVIGDKKLAQDATLRKGKLFSIMSPAALDGLGPCVGITIWTPQKKFVAHSAPEFDLPQFIGEPIKKAVKTLRESMKHSYDEMVAFITGGVQAAEKDMLSKESAALVNAYYDEIMKYNIPTTVIAQQIGYAQNSRINTYLTYNNAFVTGKPIDMLESVEKSKPEKAEEVLSEIFDFVEISPRVPVEISEKMSKLVKTST